MCADIGGGGGSRGGGRKRNELSSVSTVGGTSCGVATCCSLEKIPLTGCSGTLGNTGGNLSPSARLLLSTRFFSHSFRLIYSLSHARVSQMSLSLLCLIHHHSFSPISTSQPLPGPSSHRPRPLTQYIQSLLFPPSSSSTSCLGSQLNKPPDYSKGRIQAWCCGDDNDDDDHR